MLIISLFFVIFGSQVLCFNFDLDFPIIFKDPEARNSSKTYFGYAIAMYPGNGMGAKKWIRIGAPKANDSFHSTVPEPGMVYDCEVSIGCKPMFFPRHNEVRIKEIWNKGWIGGTMDISYTNERLAVCGFRRYYVIHKDYNAMGTCFWSFLNSTNFKLITPLLDSDKTTGTINSKTFYLYGQGQAGFSAHFPENSNELILGAPGVFNWAGTPFKVSDRINSDPPSNRRKRDNIDPLDIVEVPNVVQSEANGLFGYSVTSGHFYGNEILYYVSGSPKVSDYRGKVQIFTFNGIHAIHKKEHREGQELGEYFGGSLASGEINGDIYDDLLVGAPYFSGKTYNEGRVYIFLGGKGNLKSPTILSGKNKGAQFGAAIMYMGDINRDGFGDVAISAPFENDNTGTVYIFKGTSQGLQMEPCQIIIGKDISPDILGFGITISKPIDMDDNGYEDVAIGAPLSDSVVFLRSRPLVVVHYSFSSDPKVLSIDLREFTINICFSYAQFQENQLDLTYNIIVDKILGRANIETSSSISQNISIMQYFEPHCEKINVTIKDSLDLDISTPIKVSVSYALNYPVTNKSVTIISNGVQQDNDMLCIRCPVLDIYKSNETFFETDIPFSLGCGADNECHSFLTIDLVFPDLSEETFVLGSSNYLKLQANIENTQENAYSTKLYLVLPESVYFRQTPNKCKSVNESALLCDIGNPLKQSENRSIDSLEIDVKNVNKDFDKDHLDIYLRTITSGNNTNDDTLRYSLKFRREADITIFGTTQQEMNYFGNSSNSSSLTHIYKIEKYGVSSLEKLIVKIQVPFKYKTDEREITFLETSGIDAYFGGQPFTCEVDGTTVQKKIMPIDFEDNLLRRRRDVEVFRNISEKNKKEDLKINDEEVTIANKTLFLNCSTPEMVTCFDVICNFGPYDKEKTPASIQLNMMVNVTMLAEFAETMDMVLISTNGQVLIDSPKNFIQNGDREDSVVISSVFINDILKAGKVALWIVILAVIFGLLLLILLILLFIKIGFFKRTKKEELKNLKAAAVQEDKIMEIIQGSQEQEECGDEIVELDPPFENEVNSSKEDLCEK